ncbi:MAG: preprotein translocase subunit YajC [Desulfovibrionaceae bacterium]
MFFESLAHAMAPGAAGGGGQGGAFAAFMPLILMFAIFYFLLIRPQQKKQKLHKQMLTELGRGDYILTSGGLYGRITGASEEVLTVELAEGLEIKVNRNFVSGKVENPGVSGKKKKDKDDKKEAEKKD